MCLSPLLGSYFETEGEGAKGGQDKILGGLESSTKNDASQKHNNNQIVLQISKYKSTDTK